MWFAAFCLVYVDRSGNKCRISALIVCSICRLDEPSQDSNGINFLLDLEDRHTLHDDHLDGADTGDVSLLAGVEGAVATR